MLLAIASVSDAEGTRRRAVAGLVTRRPTACCAIAVAVFVVMYAVVPHPACVGTGDTAEHVLLGLAAVFVLLEAVFGDHAGGLARTVLRWRILAWIGLVSYAVYLYHADVITSVNKRVIAHDLPRPVLWVALFSLVLVCAVAAVSYYVVERPFLRYKDRPRRPVVHA
jgi:peptidoglycan/LPS O-acetylase OafA/YrhL